jgi:hypothetical protein
VTAWIWTPELPFEENTMRINENLAGIPGLFILLGEYILEPNQSVVVSNGLLIKNIGTWRLFKKDPAKLPDGEYFNGICTAPKNNPRNYKNNALLFKDALKNEVYVLGYDGKVLFKFDGPLDTEYAYFHVPLYVDGNLRLFDGWNTVYKYDNELIEVDFSFDNTSTSNFTFHDPNTVGWHVSGDFCVVSSFSQQTMIRLSLLDGSVSVYNHNQGGSLDNEFGAVLFERELFLVGYREREGDWVAQSNEFTERRF